MKDLKKAARKLLLELGAPVSSKGFNYTVEVLADAIVNEKPIVNGSKLTQEWGDKFGERAGLIDRNLRYVKDVCIEKRTEKFNEIFGNAAGIKLYEFLGILRYRLEDEVEGM